MSRLFLAMLIVFCSLAAQAQRDHESFSGNTDTVFVQGLVAKPFTIIASKPADLNFVAVPPQNLTNASGETRKKFGASKGILLRDILRKAEADIGHKERGKYYVVVTAADGMQVIFAYIELMHGPASAGAYLLLTDGVSGMEGAGRFTVLCTSDIATVPRYVKWVRSIELRKI